VNQVNNTVVEGKRISVELARDKGAHGDEGGKPFKPATPDGGVGGAAAVAARLREQFASAACSILVWGVAEEVNAKRLKHRVRKVGPVVSLELPFPEAPEAVQPGGVACVVTNSKEVATRMAAALDQHVLHGSTLVARRYGAYTAPRVAHA
jgi:hypothetical protein